LPPEGAWWLRDRVENRVPISLATSVVAAREVDGRVALKMDVAHDRGERKLIVDHVVAGSGYAIDFLRLKFLSAKLLAAIEGLEAAPKLNAVFEASVPGLHFIGPASAMNFGPLFRFVVGAEYTARSVCAHLASKAPLKA
jgi:hypothetical protein